MLTIVKVWVVSPDTPSGRGSKSALFCCHLYFSVPESVVVVTMNLTVVPRTTFTWSDGYWVIVGGTTGG